MRRIYPEFEEIIDLADREAADEPPDSGSDSVEAFVLAFVRRYQEASCPPGYEAESSNEPCNDVVELTQDGYEDDGDDCGEHETGDTLEIPWHSDHCQN